MEEKSHKRIKTQDYYHPSVLILIERLEETKFSNICLCGFGDIMKWLSRILNDKKYNIELTDTRKEFFNYECGDKKVKDIRDINLTKDNLIIICSDDPFSIKKHISFISKNLPIEVPVIYDTNPKFNPLRQDEPFRTIISKAEKRAKSMIKDEQLFDLIQLIKLTKNIKGKVVEYGSLHGGSGAVIAEAINFYGTKNLYLFDTFFGIPESEYGLDYRWTNSFSNNSYTEVRDAFNDLKNVTVIKGNIKETHKEIDGPFSFAYIASDTFESGKYLMEYVWPRLSSGGIVHTCDFGSYPNCLPLTLLLEEFEKNNPEVVSYRTASAGIYFVKP
tara:strand:- start:980 stop:1972 length:993 start_codon:yes stop_codon:yes gene_type:complete